MGGTSTGVRTTREEEPARSEDADATPQRVAARALATTAYALMAPALGARLSFVTGTVVESAIDPAAVRHALDNRDVCLEDADPLDLLIMSALWDSETEIDLQGRTYLPYLPEFCAYVAVHGPSLLKVRFGSIARGELCLHYGSCDDDRRGLYTNAMSELWMAHPTLPDVPDQRMAIRIVDDEIFGAVGRAGPGDVPATELQRPLDDWARTYGPALLALPDFRDATAPSTLRNELRDGALQFVARDYAFSLPGPGDSRFAGRATIDLEDERGVVGASATLRAPSLAEAHLELHRLAAGGFTGTARLNVGPFGDTRGGHTGFSGALTASYGRGLLDVEGLVRYDGARISGSGTLRLTDAVTGWAAVSPQIVAAIGRMPPTMAPATGLVLVGWGSMDYRFGDWLSARASVVVAPDGHIYSRGELRPVSNIRFLDPPRSSRRSLAGPYSASFTLADAAFASLEASASLQLWGESSLGPGQIHRVHLVGAFSSNHRVPWQLAIGGTVHLGARAQLELIAEVAIEGKLLDVATVIDVGATIHGSASLQASAEATASIGRRLRGDDPERAEYFLEGDFAAHAALAAGLRGSIDFGLLGHGWTLWRSDDHVWPLGDVSFERHLAYTFGSPATPNVSVEVPDLDATDLLSALVHRSAPESAGAPQRAIAQGTWRSAAAPAVAPYREAARAPTPAVEEPPLPPFEPVSVVAGSSAVGSSGASDDGIRDAGVPPAAGVPPQEEPYDVFPAPPPRTEVEFDDETQVVHFHMQGVPHRLRLIPGHPPRLIVESSPEPLVDAVNEEIADERREGDEDGVRILEGVREEALEVIEAADALGVGERAGMEAPGLVPLAQHLEVAGTQLDLRGLHDPAANVASVPLQPSATDADSTLGLPWPAFMEHVLTLSPVDAITVLDAQYDYLSAQIDSLNARRRELGRGDPSYGTVQDRFMELGTRLLWVTRQRHRYRFELNPLERVALPCFPAGTLVHTPSGPRAIESLAVGDDVWSADPESGVVVAGRVEGLIVKRALDLVDVHVGEERVSATAAHPFWVKQRAAWVAASALEPGMTLSNLAGDDAAVTQVVRRSLPVVPTFNLALGPYPTYFVGMGLLVHNGSYALWRTYPWKKQLDFKIYVLENDADEFKGYVYVGQTTQRGGSRERQHHDEAERRLREGGLSPQDRFFFRFKQGARLTVICDGLKGESARESMQARYLEQKNIEEERKLRPRDRVLNRIEASADIGALERLIRSDPDVIAEHLCTSSATP